ncbi:hypothetical protein F5B21DRAFT_453276 [Xylaria acuta]|nr:hypothetical protein F5B21DRAFT_453276 [Xylaria acuta]
MPGFFRRWKFSVFVLSLQVCPFPLFGIVQHRITFTFAWFKLLSVSIVTQRGCQIPGPPAAIQSTKAQNQRQRERLSSTQKAVGSRQVGEEDGWGETD